MKIGIDVDGILADFNTAFAKRYVEVTGRDLFYLDKGWTPNEIDCWNYPIDQYGYTKAEDQLVWASVKADRDFWYTLPSLEQTTGFLKYMRKLTDEGHDIYFITNRPGVETKLQTECWLGDHGLGHPPTVLISSEKGECCHALALDCYIDDRTENCQDATELASRTTKVFMLARPWNEEVEGVARIHSLGEYVDYIKGFINGN